MGCGCRGGARNNNSPRPVISPRLQAATGGPAAGLTPSEQRKAAMQTAAQDKGLNEQQRQAHADRRKAISKALGR